MQDKKLFKSKNDRKIAGVCGGVAKYLNIGCSCFVGVVLLYCRWWSFGLYYMCCCDA